jgi:hypothetical protein
VGYRLRYIETIVEAIGQWLAVPRRYCLSNTSRKSDLYEVLGEKAMVAKFHAFEALRMMTNKLPKVAELRIFR